MDFNFTEVFNCISEKVLPIIQSYRKDISSLNIELKEDRTLLTQADLEVQKVIMDTINVFDKNADFIAEEANYTRNAILNNKYTWIIDPIDGTKQFTTPESNEFCTAICVLENGYPISAMMLLPEIGIDNKPLLAIASVKNEEIIINGLHAKLNDNQHSLKNVSSTRSKGTTPHFFEEKVIELGSSIKNRTTSQSIDLLRTAVDISELTQNHLTSFDVFYRENQKIWDGAPGMCFNIVAKHKIINTNGNNLLPFSNDILEKQLHPIVIVGNEVSINKIFFE